MTHACKMIYLARRNPGLDADDFPQAWREHSALGRQCRNVQDKVTRVAQCSRIGGLLLRGVELGYDGVGLLHLRDRAAADAIWSDPETLAIMRPDELRVFAGHVRDFTLVAEEYVLREADAASPVVLYGFLRRHAGLSHADFVAQWTSAAPRWMSGPLATGACGVVHNAVVLAPPGYEFDGVAEWWFESAAALTAACGVGGVRKALPAATAELADLRHSMFVATEVTHRRP